MSGQEQLRRPERPAEPEATGETPGQSEKGEKLKADIDEILDEIEGVLEDNAEAFVAAYVQKGGE